MNRTLYCYNPQIFAVQQLLPEMGLTPTLTKRSPIGVIARAEDVRGLSQGNTFVEVEGHSHPVPDDIRREIALRGFLTITLSDKFLRAVRPFG